MISLSCCPCLQTSNVDAFLRMESVPFPAPLPQPPPPSPPPVERRHGPPSIGLLTCLASLFSRAHGYGGDPFTGYSTPLPFHLPSQGRRGPVPSWVMMPMEDASGSGGWSGETNLADTLAAEPEVFDMPRGVPTSPENGAVLASLSKVVSCGVCFENLTAPACAPCGLWAFSSKPTQQIVGRACVLHGVSPEVRRHERTVSGLPSSDQPLNCPPYLLLKGFLAWHPKLLPWRVTCIGSAYEEMLCRAQGR